MIDIFSEHLIRLRDVPDHLPRRGSKKLHPSTVYRWAVEGVNGPDSKIFLESVKTGGSVYTSLEALERFSRQQSQPSKPPTRTEVQGAKEQRQGASRTNDVLKEMDGWKPSNGARDKR